MSKNVVIEVPDYFSDEQIEAIKKIVDDIIKGKRGELDQLPPSGPYKSE